MGSLALVLQHMSHIFWPPVSCETRVASNPSTSAQVNMGVILSLPSSARRSPVVFSSALLFVLAWHHEVKPLACSSLEIPTPTVFPQVPLFRWGQLSRKHLVYLMFLDDTLRRRVNVHHLLTGNILEATRR